MTDDEYRKRARAFADEDVVRAYAHRPDYPAALFEALLAHVPDHNLALDLGTGTGKIAGRLAPYFARVDAVDPSEPMLVTARRNWPAQNINWICARTEKAALEPAYDLITAAASIHWMAPEATFPKLARHLAPDARLAIITADGARELPWKTEIEAFADRWTTHDGGAFDRSRQDAIRTTLRRWIDIEERVNFEHDERQTIAEFLQNLHSHSNWSRAHLGTRTAAFDAEATECLTPFLHGGALNYSVITHVTVCRPRTIPKEADAE